MGAFAMVLREGIFSVPSHVTLAESTIRGAISYVSQMFSEMTGQTQQKTKTTNLEDFYQGSTEPTKNSDPNPKQQKAIPICVFADSKIKQQRPNEPRVSWQLEVSSMHADRVSI